MSVTVKVCEGCVAVSARGGDFVTHVTVLFIPE